MVLSSVGEFWKVRGWLVWDKYLGGSGSGRRLLSPEAEELHLPARPLPSTTTISLSQYPLLSN